MPAFCVEDYLNMKQSDTVWVWRGLIPCGGSAVLYGSPKVGKALALTTPILTPKGWRYIKEIQPGDFVYTPTGHPTEVVACSPVYTDRPCFKVKFQNGECITADMEHLWKVSTAHPRFGSAVPRIMTTQELVNTGVRKQDGKNSKYLRALWRVELPAPLVFPIEDKPLLLDPYFLGAWLGDGTASMREITSADPEILDILAAKGVLSRKNVNTPYGYKVYEAADDLGILHKLQKLGVYKNKHIPDQYMKTSVENRKALLAGLLDTDGWSNAGTAYFYNTNGLLAHQVYELAISLGLKVKMDTKLATLYGKYCGICWVVAIRSTFNPFLLTRKAATFVANKETYLTIISITPVEAQDTKCIQVADPSGMFLAGRGCIPTHNSWMALGIAEAVADKGIEDYLGLPIDTHGNVLYVQLDTPRSLWSTGYLRSIKSTLARKGVYIIDREMEDLPKQFDIRMPNCTEWLRTESNKVQPVLVIIDTIRRMHRGNENESDTMAVVHDSFIAATTPAALLYLAHKKKAQQGETGDGSVRGSSAFTGAVDALINMSKSKLVIEARSDVEEEIAIYQLDNGGWSRNSDEDNINEFIAGLGGSKTQMDEMIAEKFTVSSRTARRWRVTFEKGGK